jgi:hypothetical protein
MSSVETVLELELELELELGMEVDVDAAVAVAAATSVAGGGCDATAMEEGTAVVLDRLPRVKYANVAMRRRWAIAIA